MDDAGNVTQDGQQKVDEEVGTAAALEEDSERRQHDGADNLDDVGSGERHCGGCVGRGWFGVVVCVDG